MCVEGMDTRCKNHTTAACRRKTMRAGSQFRWKLLHFSAEEDEAFGPVRGGEVRASIRMFLRRQHKWARMDRLVLGKKEKGESVCEEERLQREPQGQPQGAKAPENTTQFLMSNVYADMSTTTIQTVPDVTDTYSQLYGESLSPSSVYQALDSGYESCLAYQQRDFEEAYELCR